MLHAVHGVEPHLSVHRHFAQFGGDFAVLNYPDGLGDERCCRCHQFHTLVDAAQVSPATEVCLGTQPLQQRGGVVEHEDPVPGHQHVVEEQHCVLLVVHRTQWVSVAAGPLGHGFAAQYFQTGCVCWDGERQDESGVERRMKVADRET